MPEADKLYPPRLIYSRKFSNCQHRICFVIGLLT